MENMINVLDKGYVRLVDTMGSDLSVVNSARVSYNKAKDELDSKDERLIDFLAREGHTSPFRHTALQFEVYAPLMVARQWWKYIIGSMHAEQDPLVAWNESSRRYITEESEFYLIQPDEWRSKPENSKQGSGQPIDAEAGKEYTDMLIEMQKLGEHWYQKAIENGIAAEQARLFLPAYGLYVRWYWTASLQGVAHFLNQRLEHDAQKEIQDFAQAVHKLTVNEFPVSLERLLKRK